MEYQDSSTWHQRPNSHWLLSTTLWSYAKWPNCWWRPSTTTFGSWQYCQQAGVATKASAKCTNDDSGLNSSKVNTATLSINTSLTIRCFIINYSAVSYAHHFTQSNKNATKNEAQSHARCKQRPSRWNRHRRIRWHKNCRTRKYNNGKCKTNRNCERRKMQWCSFHHSSFPACSTIRFLILHFVHFTVIVISVYVCIRI